MMSQPARVARVERALLLIANLKRRLILLILADGPMSVSALAKALRDDVSGTGHNLRRMKEGGLLTARRRKKEVYYSVNRCVDQSFDPIASALRIRIDFPDGVRFQVEYPVEPRLVEEYRSELDKLRVTCSAEHMESLIWKP